MRAVTDASEHPNEAFAIALSLSRAGDFFAPTPEEEHTLHQFTQFAHDMDSWLAAQSAPDGTFQGDDYSVGLMLNNATMLQQPFIEDEAVLRTRLHVLDLLCQYNIGSSELLASFRDRVQTNIGQVSITEGVRKRYASCCPSSLSLARQ